jgi:hypothetical protein
MLYFVHEAESVKCPTTCNKDQICRQTPRGPTCTCPDGYDLNFMTNTCEGIRSTIKVFPRNIEAQLFFQI